MRVLFFFWPIAFCSVIGAVDATNFRCYAEGNRNLVIDVEPTTNKIKAFSYISQGTIYLAKATMHIDRTYAVELFRPISAASGEDPDAKKTPQIFKFSLPEKLQKTRIETSTDIGFNYNYYPLQFYMMVPEDSAWIKFFCTGT